MMRTANRITQYSSHEKGRSKPPLLHPPGVDDGMTTGEAVTEVLEDVADVPPALERQNKIRLYHVGIIARIICRKSAIHYVSREVTDNNMTAYAYICIFFWDKIY